MTPGAGLDIYNDRDQWSTFGCFEFRSFYVFSIRSQLLYFLVVK